MATKTTHLGLSKAELTDAVRSTLTANNENFDKIDEAYAEVNETIDAKEQALQGQIDRLRANQVKGSASGTEVVVQDAAEMESVLQLSGNSEQDSRSGKNKLKNTATTQTINGITFTVNEDKTITVKGTATANTNLSITKNCNLEIGKKYTLRGTGYVQPHSDIIIQSLDYQEYYVTFADKVTFTPQNNTVFEVVLRIFKDANVDMIVYPQIEEGTELTSYEPYGVQPSPDYPSEIRSVSGDVELKVEGKNLLDVNTEILNLYFDANTKKFTASTHARSVVLEVEPNTAYTLSRQTGYGNDFSWATSKEYPVLNGDITNYKVHWGTDRLVTVANTGTKDKYLLLYFAYDGTDEVCRGYLSQIQIERGEVQTPLVPHVEPTIVQLPLGDIELRSTPDGTRDTFARVDGVWNYRGNIYSERLLENDIGNYRAVDYNEEFVGFIIQATQVHTAGGNKIENCMCNQFIRTNKVYDGNLRGIWMPDKNRSVYITIEKNRLSDTSTPANAVASFKTFLAENPLYIVYALDTPIYTPITDQALISALDELEQLILHKGYNRITATSVNGVKAQLDLSYYKDINTVLNNITAMIATIGGEMNV